MKMTDAAQNQDVRELDLEQLDAIADGGKQGGPICPKCGSTNVLFDRVKRVVTKCNACGYKA